MPGPGLLKNNYNCTNILYIHDIKIVKTKLSPILKSSMLLSPKVRTSLLLSSIKHVILLVTGGRKEPMVDVFCRQPTRDIYCRAYKSLFTSLVQLILIISNEISLDLL